ncbi:MAG: hypothetical protein AAGA80_16620 [Cyanobacteria bacterium P01_F01_bin.143]
MNVFKSVIYVIASIPLLTNVEKELLWLDLAENKAAAYDWIGKNSKPILK